MARSRGEIKAEITEVSEIIRQMTKRAVFHSGGTRREIENHSLKEMLEYRRSLYAELARLDGQSAIVLAAL